MKIKEKNKNHLTPFPHESGRFVESIRGHDVVLFFSSRFWWCNGVAVDMYNNKQSSRRVRSRLR